LNHHADRRPKVVTISLQSSLQAQCLQAHCVSNARPQATGPAADPECVQWTPQHMQVQSVFSVSVCCAVRFTHSHL
jgi:hypothetical protein